MKKRSPLGSSNFKLILEEDRYYVDKTLLVRNILNGDHITLLCRPRRFGKTLNMNMLRCFFAKGEDNRRLFEGLNISRDAESMEHLGRYPVIFCSFKDAKQDHLEGTLFDLNYAILEAWKEHAYLGKSEETGEEYQDWLQKLDQPNPDRQNYQKSLQKLSQLLHQYHKERVVVLIDEYDTPVHAGWQNNYYDKIVSFLKGLFGSALKDNGSLKKGVLTGILRVSKESMFSDLNNFTASTVLDSDAYSDAFGFTEEEVMVMLRHYDMNGRELEELHEWYDGYQFGRHRIYNPWSILNYVFSLEHSLKPYWVNTSQDVLLRRLFFNNVSGIRAYIEPLIRGEKIALQLGEHLVFKDLLVNPGAAQTMLSMSGYLKAENKRNIDWYDVSIPNKEVRYAYLNSIQTWLQSDMGANTRQKMLDALSAGRVLDFELHLADFTARVFGYFDTAAGKFAENFYHAFFLGLFAGLEDRYALRSNREEGHGRYDICLSPHDRSQKGIVIEVKAPTEKKESLAHALNAAVEQIKRNKYDAGLKEAGIVDVLRLAIAVQGKKVRVQEIK
jgi:Predicted AAA-ATPase/PD-(D/E)XK nuclease superfamily